jgi:hypothetical protein
MDGYEVERALTCASFGRRWMIVGGISFGTVFALSVVPTAYTLLARGRAPTVAAPAAAEPAPVQQAVE